jgi:Flp pilus assembly protein TadG
MKRAGRADDAERGSFAIEVAILVPALVFFLLLVVAAGRTETAKATVDAAARDAARSASLSRTSGDALTAARATAAATLKQQGVSCSNPKPAQVNRADFAPPLGQTGQVTVTVTCVVLLRDLTFLPGLPGTVTETSSFTSVVDAYRAR